jgi:hypothetical protein
VTRGAPVVVGPVAPAAPALDGHDVVGVQAESDDAIEPRAVERGHDEPERLDQVRREVDVDLALEQRFAHEAEVEVLQVAQTAVDELARPRRRAGRVVVALHERDAIAAGRGVEGDAGARDPAADHEHVERFTGQRVDGVGARQHVR